MQTTPTTLDSESIRGWADTCHMTPHMTFDTTHDTTLLCESIRGWADTCSIDVCVYI